MMNDLTPEQKQQHFQNLIGMTRVDGEITPAEKQMLLYVAMKWGLTDTDWESVLENPVDLNVAMPDNEAARFQQLFDLVDVMIADGDLKRSELAYCEKMCAQLGYQAAAIHRIKQAILEANRAGKPVESILEDTRRAISPLQA